MHGYHFLEHPHVHRRVELDVGCGVLPTNPIFGMHESGLGWFRLKLTWQLSLCRGALHALGKFRRQGRITKVVQRYIPRHCAAPVARSYDTHFFFHCRVLVVSDLRLRRVGRCTSRGACRRSTAHLKLAAKTIKVSGFMPSKDGHRLSVALFYFDGILFIF